MSVPKSVIKFKRGGVEYVSSVDRTLYTITELTRAALRDVGRYICRMCNKEAAKLHGMRKSRRVRGRTSAFQFCPRLLWRYPQVCFYFPWKILPRPAFLH